MDRSTQFSLLTCSPRFMLMFKFTIMLMVFKRCTGITNQVLVGAGVSGSLHGPGILLAGEYS